jgi:hypothetical protein
VVDFSIDIQGFDRCSVCQSTSLENIFYLENFPLTGIFVEKKEPESRDGHDQSLHMCNDCGHAQLGSILPGSFLYGDHYAHRSSASHITPSSFKFILEYLESNFGNKFSQALEIGCNDLVLLKELSSRARKVAGIDPIWIDKQPDDLLPNMQVIGDFIENVDLAAQISEAPDLVVSTHNFEHIIDPLAQLKRLLEAASDNAVFIIELPDLHSMVNNLRFDQVFHQHFHYFSLASFLTMIGNAGGHYIDHSINYRNWGGSFTVAFSNNPDRANDLPINIPTANPTWIKDRYQLFKDGMANVKRLIEGLDGEIWAYGAAQMLPTLAYHLETDFSFLTGIMDDCPLRNGKTYPTIPVQIHKPDEKTSLKDQTVIITALDAIRPITNRLIDFDPKFIVNPSLVY